jgi:hypothetical protein
MIKTLKATTRILRLQLYLQFHHYTIFVSSQEETLINKLREEFHFFLAEEPPRVHSTIELFRENAPELPSMLAVKILETCTVYKLGHRQYINYEDKALTIWDRHEDSVRIYSLEIDRLFEIAYLAIHSLLGQELDSRGLCRTHALGVSLGNLNALIMLPSKGGKSTLLTHLLENPEIKIISDDMPLIDFKGQVYSFPSKVSMTNKPEEGPLAGLTWTEFNRTQYPPKWTASLSSLKDRIETKSYMNANLLIAGFRLSHGESILTPVKKWKMIMPLLEHMIMGFGLPQVMEMFLNFRFYDFFKLFFHAIIRTICAVQLLRKSRCFHLYMGPDRSYNAQLLLDLIYEQQNS